MQVETEMIKLTAIARLIVDMCWHLWCTGTWWVCIRAVGLYSDDVGSLVSWSSSISCTPWLVSINTGASIKYSSIEYIWEGTTITTSGCRICWRFTWFCPDRQESSPYIKITWSECDSECVGVTDDAPWLRCLSTMFGDEIVRVQFYPIKTAWSIILNI